MDSISKNEKIYVAGHRGLAGSAILSRLSKAGYTNFLTRTHSELDLLDSPKVEKFFSTEKPVYVFLAAARVGGIIANNAYRADFIYQNLQIQNNIIYHSYKHNVKKLIFLGSSCIYPKNAPQPIKEESLLTGELEYTNEPYAIAKIAGIKMCESFNLQYGTNFIPVMPTNLYGKNDNFNLETSHVLPAVLRKLHLSKCLDANDWDSLSADFNKYPVEGVNGSATMEEIAQKLNKYGIRKENETVYVRFWGTGKPLREFLYSSDLADACIFVFEKLNFSDLVTDASGLNREVSNIKNTHVNIGTGKDISIKELVEKISVLVGFKGKIEWDHDKPDGTSQKLLDVGKIRSLGWKEKYSLDEGLKEIYRWYLETNRDDS